MTPTRIQAIALVFGCSLCVASCKPQGRQYATSGVRSVGDAGATTQVAWDPQVKTMLTTSCDGADCHNANEVKNKLQLSIDGVKTNFEILLTTVDGPTKKMPPATAVGKIALTLDQVNQLKAWKQASFPATAAPATGGTAPGPTQQGQPTAGGTAPVTPGATGAPGATSTAPTGSTGTTSTPAADND
ncbi:MAG: hypothetical protein AB7T49_03770 [Oligoflexales bacterium]